VTITYYTYTKYMRFFFINNPELVISKKEYLMKIIKT